jgi:hypothetical protein
MSSTRYFARAPVAFASVKGIASLLVLSLAFAWLGGGCASSSGGSSAPKPGRGIAEYRTVAREAHESVVATVKSLESLAQPWTQTSSPHPALPGFDRAFHELELTSIRARAHAEAIIARGQSYFDEWKEHIDGVTNQAAARAETDRYTRLFEHFGQVRQRSGEVREEFRPFMMKLRVFRARLDQPPGPTAGDSFGKQLEGLTAAGRRVLQTLESVGTALDDAEAALRATLATKE